MERFPDHPAANDRKQGKGHKMVIVGYELYYSLTSQPAQDGHKGLKEPEHSCHPQDLQPGRIFSGDAGAESHSEAVCRQTYGYQEN